MASRNYLDRIMSRRSLGGFYSSSSLSALNDTSIYSLGPRRLRQHYPCDKKISQNKETPTATLVTKTDPPVMPSSPNEKESENIESQSQATLDLIDSSLKCDDCQTNAGLFQCCHCNQRLCIRCCNKHYKKVTIELERLHELSDRLMAKIVHTKNDLERQKNETLEQCHKWRVDTINTINKAHTLIVQTIHNEYEILGKEYELFVQKEMANLNIDQNELLRMKKGNLGSILTTPSTAATETVNSIDTVRKRIEAFAKNIDEAGKFLFQVQLPDFDIDDRLRVESRFGDVTRCTSATWQNEGTTSMNLNTENSVHHDLQRNDNSKETNIHHTEHDDFMPENQLETDSDFESHTPRSFILPSLSSPLIEADSEIASSPSSRYSMSADHDMEIQQQNFYRPGFPDERYDSAYGTAPSSPSIAESNHQDPFLSNSSNPCSPIKKSAYSSDPMSGSSYQNRRHTHSFHRVSSPLSDSHHDPDEDRYQSVQQVEVKREEDGSIEGVAIKIEQSKKTEGFIKQSRTCVEACGIRRRTTIIPPQTSAFTQTRSFNDRPWLYYRTTSSPSIIP